MRTTASLAIAAVAGTALALSAPLAAQAHVSANATSTAAGSYTVVTFSVPHGCEESPTQVVTIDLPESVPSVTPTVNPSWSVEMVTEGDRMTQVVYTSLTGGLPSDLRDTFALSLRLPEGASGDRIEFPVTQTCTEGTAEWVGEDVPVVVLTAATGDDHGHGTEGGYDEAGDAHSDEATAGGSEAATGSPAQVDLLARVLGVVGLIVGAVGIALAVLARRPAAKA
jgi:uncharacterized protein YcnI